MQNTKLHNPRPAGPLDFPRPARGRVWTPPSLSAPAHRRAKPKTALERSSKNLRNYFGYFLRQVEIEVIRGQNVKSMIRAFRGIWPQIKVTLVHNSQSDPTISNCTSFDAAWREERNDTNFMSLSLCDPKLLAEKKVGDLEWPQVTFKGVSEEKITWSINKCPAWSDSIQIISSWSRKQGVYLLPLTYNMRLQKWPDLRS